MESKAPSYPTFGYEFTLLRAVAESIIHSSETERRIRRSQAVAQPDFCFGWGTTMV